MPTEFGASWARDRLLRWGQLLWQQRGWVRDRSGEIAVVLGLVLVVAGTAGFVGVLEAVQENDDLAQLDRPALRVLVSLRSAPVTAALTAVTTVTGPVVLPVIVLLAALAWGLLAHQWWQAGVLAVAMIVSTAVSVTIKAVVARPRPPVDVMTVPGVEASYSFPSGHTIGAATLLLVGAYLAWVRRPTAVGLVAWLVAVLAGTGLVALSRLYLGYHFVTDVVASMSLAVAVLGAVVVVDRRRAVRAVRGAAAQGPDRS